LPQVKLKAQSVGDFLDAPLKTDRIARTRNYGRLPPISMVLTYTDFYATYAQSRDDHFGELFGGLAIDESPGSLMY
jgi:hypothetical protein